MRFAALFSLVTVLPVAVHSAMDHWFLVLGAVAGALVSLGVIHTKLVRPCWTFCKGLVGDLASMKATIDTVPERFDAGDARMTEIERLGAERASKIEDIDAKLALIADADAQAIRTSIAAAAARHAGVLTEDQARVHWRD